MPNKILLKRSSTPGAIPAAGVLDLGELAVNSADGKLYLSSTTVGSVVQVGYDKVSKAGDTMTGTLIAPMFKTTTGTATQFLKGDGSLDTTTYQVVLTNPITGSGAVNAIPKFGTSTGLTNSSIFDDGTLITFNNNTNIIGGFTASTISVPGGTSSQFLKANGTLDNNAYLNVLLSGTSNGLATLDSFGKVPSSQLPTINIPVTTVFGRSGDVVAQAGDYDTSLIPDTLDKRYQTDNQKLFNDVTASTQTQLNNLQSGVNNATTGSGTNNFISKWSGNKALGNSLLYDDGTSVVAIGTSSPFVSPIGNSFVLNDTDTSSGALVFTNVNALKMQQYFDNGLFSFEAAAGVSMNFISSGVEHMRLEDGGNLLIGTTADNGTDKLQVNGSASFSGNVTASGFVVPNGLSTEFLKADGSIDTNAYLNVLLSGTSNGIATLDANGKIPTNQLGSAVMEWKGLFTPSASTLVNGVGSAGDVWEADSPGTHDFGAGGITFATGDWAVYNGTVWEKSVSSNSVNSVFGRAGTVVAQAGDYDTSLVPDTVDRRYQTDLQSANNDATSPIQEQLDGKLSLATGGVVSGPVQATQFKITGAPADEFLMADGSVTTVLDGGTY